MDEKHHYHDLRDRKGRFTKLETINWSKEKQAMTIENETGEEVKVSEALPQTLPIGGDQSVIREGMRKVTDWILDYSTWSQKQKEIEDEMKKLTTALENAEARVKAAEEEKNKANLVAQQAIAGEKMAKEAYIVADAQRVEAIQKKAMYAEEITELKQEVDLKTAAVDQLKADLKVNQDLLEAAREERDRFREDRGAAEALLETATNEHATTLATRDGTIAELRKECEGLHHKINGLEDSNKAHVDRLTRLQSRLDSIRHAVVD